MNMIKALALFAGLALAPPCAQAASWENIYGEALSFIGAGRQTLTFAGKQWSIKTSMPEAAGPGPNLFSNQKKNVWVDEKGRLHLSITHNKDGRWLCAEIISEESFGYGTYTFTLDGPVEGLDPNAVLGLFTYADDNREIDIEFSRWGKTGDHNAQFVVQPGADPDGIKRFDGPKGTGSSTHSFSWQAGQVDFQSMAEGNVLASSTARQNVPLPDKEKVHINLWLFRGAPHSVPSQPALSVSEPGRLEVIVSGFKFTPAP